MSGESTKPRRVDLEQPYNELPGLPPACEIETPRVLKAVIGAREALAELRTACRLIPNPTVITSTIPLREARASSEIENIVTTNDELFRAKWRVDAEPTPATKEALAYSEALFRGVESLADRPVSIKTATIVCEQLQRAPALIRSSTGTYIGDPALGRRVYTPPEGEDVILAHLGAWERFIYSDHGYDPVVLMALAHYQFEAIHPFYDGNGRTGRILNILMLLQERLLDLPVLYLSGYIVANKSEYYRLLQAVTAEGVWQDWVMFMVQAVEQSAKDASALICELRDAQDEMVEKIREVGIAPAKDLADLLFVKPYLRIADVVEAGLVQRHQATAWLNKLVDSGQLREERAGRTRLFINQPALQVLTRV